jgi:short-subunit dehydrogenase
MELKGRNALLTGASGGIGRRLAAALAARGMNLALSGRDEERLGRAAEEAKAQGVKAVVVPADLADPDAAAALAGRAEEALGPIDLLVNNAGIETVGAYAAHAREELERMVAVNLTAPMLLVHAVLPGMLERGRGHVVSMSSIAGKSGVSCAAPYSATKAALVGLTRSLRQEHRDRGVGFSVVCPGFVDDDGMYVKMANAGAGKAPAMLAPSPIEKVVDAVLHVVERDVPERIVNRGPLRPVFALAEVAPGLSEKLSRVGGGNQYFERVARARGRA